MAGFCEHGNETSGPIKCGEFLKKLKNYYFLKTEPVPWSWSFC